MYLLLRRWKKVIWLKNVYFCLYIYFTYMYLTLFIMNKLMGLINFYHKFMKYFTNLLF